MSDMPTPEEFAQALSELPDEFKAQIGGIVPAQEEQDTVAIKLELIKFVTDLKKHNQGVDWETNKQKPRRIGVDEIIKDSQTLFDFLTE